MIIASTHFSRFGALICLAAAPVLLAACGGGQTIGGGSSGPPAATATLAQVQEQIFTPYCANCHCPGGSGPMSLTDAASSYAALVGADPTNSTARQAGEKRVVPGDPSKSFLLNKLTGQMDFGEGDVMPQNGTSLTAAQVALIRSWIQAGAPEN
jgi:mono/diheme cytochrome c family protein